MSSPSILFQEHTSAIPGSFILSFCDDLQADGQDAQGADDNVEELVRYIEYTNDDSKVPLWTASVKHKMRDEHGRRHFQRMLSIDSVSPEALEDISTVRALCDISADGEVSIETYSWSMDRINQR